MRTQARAYILAHGGDPDAMSEQDLTLVMVALNDGLIGNKAVLNTLGLLTNGVFNYMRSANSPAYTLKSILGITYDYLYRPMSDEEQQSQVNKQLLSFMAAAPGSEGKLNVGSENGRL